MIKLIASDMDGTLLDSQKNLNSEFNEVLEKISDNDIMFAAISGRELISLKNVFKDINKDIIYASNNGNLITYKDKVIFENYIDTKMINKIVEIVRKTCKHNTIYCSKDTIYSESIIPVIMARKWKLKIKVVRDITKVNDNILKVTVFGKGNLIDRYIQKFDILKEELMITPSGTFCFDICTLGGNKKQAIKILQKEFGIKYDETMVFGDHMNDLEMMESAYYSYAMENAKSEVKKKARFIAKANDENGVLEAIKDIALSDEVLYSNN